MRRFVPLFEAALIRFEAGLASEVLAPAYSSIATYRAIQRSPQYSEVQRTALLSELEADFSRDAGGRYRDSYIGLLNTLSNTLVEASEINEYSARNLKGMMRAGCMSRSCLNLIRTDLKMLNVELAGFSSQIDFRLAEGAKNYSDHLRIQPDSLPSSVVTRDLQPHAEFPFDIDAKNAELRAEVATASFREKDEAYRADFAAVKAEYLRRARTTPIEAKLPRKKDRKYTIARVKDPEPGARYSTRIIPYYELEGCAELLERLNRKIDAVQAISPASFMDLGEYHPEMRETFALISVEVSELFREPAPRELARRACFLDRRSVAALDFSADNHDR